MRLSTRKLLDRSFTSAGMVSVVLMALALLVLLTPMVVRGTGAVIFRGTVEHRRYELEKMDRGDRQAVQAQITEARAVQKRVWDDFATFQSELDSMDASARRKYLKPFSEVKAAWTKLVGPPPGAERPVLPRDQYGETRMDRAQVQFNKILNHESYDFSDPTRMGVKVSVPRSDQFQGTLMIDTLQYIRDHADAIVMPQWTFFWGFFTDEPVDANHFGGIWPALLGTIFLTLGAMIVAAPLGIIAAIYFVEYAGHNRFVSFLRVCVSTLAGVPSIVFGLFGLALFLNTLHVTQTKSVLAGSLTLALLILPTVIRAAEEAILSVPQTYREAAMGLGAGKWRTITTVTLPAALSGILTGIIISMGRAAGETAPIMFTAAVSYGSALLLGPGLLSEPTQALPWNIYNICTENQAVDEIRHVQYGMVLTLVVLVLLLNMSAVVLRARIQKKLRG